jgi:hypothetical protein
VTLSTGSRMQRGADRSIRPSELGVGRELPSQSKSAGADYVPMQLYHKPLGRTSSEAPENGSKTMTARPSTRLANG